MKLAGIDYGSKRAGTTVLAFSAAGGRLRVHQSPKGEDADAFLRRHLDALRPQLVFLDAPLSLPGVYRFDNVMFTDYFYRTADRELQAMSPMFLGGLTARAMQLCSELRPAGFRIYETYPAHLARLLDLPKAQYKKSGQSPDALLPLLADYCPVFADTPTIDNWHQFDALLALLSAWRFVNGQAESYGSDVEGQIWV